MSRLSTFRFPSNPKRTARLLNIDDSAGIAEVAHLRALPVGAPIEITGGFARTLIDNVTPLGFDLISEVDKWIVAHP